MNMRKRILAMAMAICMVAGILPVSAFATGCDHHLSHTDTCGYQEAVAGKPCSHECSTECYTTQDRCAHLEHDDACGWAAATEETPEVPCGHTCGDTCKTQVKACLHGDNHTDSCGYAPAQEGAHCNFTCDQCGTEEDQKDAPTCTGEMDCPLTEGHSDGCKKAALADCTKAADCAASVHHTDCAKDLADKEAIELSKCDKGEDCTASLHHQDCLKGKAVHEAAELAKCTGAEGCEATLHKDTCPEYVWPCDKTMSCKAESHEEGCEKAAYEAELAKCTENEDCEAPLHKDTCPKYVWPCDGTKKCKAEEHDEDCVAPLWAEFEKMLEKLPAPETVDPLDEEMLEALHEQIQVIVTFALEKGLYETTDAVTCHPTIAALLEAMQPANPLAETWTGTYDGGTLTGGTEKEPLKITVDGTVLLNGTVNIESGYVIIQGKNSGMLKRTTGSQMFFVPNGACLTVENLTLDGGAIWDGENNSILNRGTENSGITGSSLFDYKGKLVVNSCVLKNSAGSWMFNAVDRAATGDLTVTGSTISDNSDGIFWTFGTASISGTVISRNNGSPSVFRPCSGSTTTVSGCNIHHNLGNEYGVVLSYNGTINFVGGTQIHDNAALSGYNIYLSGSTFGLKNSSITGNTGALCGGVWQSTSAIHLDGATISGNTHTGETGGDNLYALHYWNDFKVGNTSGSVYISTSAKGRMPTFKKLNDNVNLFQVMNQFHYEGAVDDGSTVVPFVTGNGSAIQFVTLVLNGGQLRENVAEAGKLPTYVNDHKLFVGWCSDGCSALSCSALLGDAAPSDGQTYYALWEESHYEHFDEAKRTFDFGTMVAGGTLPDAKSLTYVYDSNSEGGGTTPQVISVAPNAYFDTEIEGLTVTVRPKEGISAGEYDETLYVTCHDLSIHTIFVKFTVTKQESVVEVGETVSGVYGQSLTLTAEVKARGLNEVTFSYNGQELDTVPVENGAAVCSYDTRRGILPVGTSNVAVSYGGSDTLAESSGIIAVTLSARELTVTGLTATNREYDGTKAVALTGGTLTGVLEGDEVTAVMPDSGTIADENAGENKSVSFAQIELAGADKDFYRLTQPTVTVNITKAAAPGDFVSYPNGTVYMLDEDKPMEAAVSAEGADISYSSSNPTVATVDTASGTVTAAGLGETTITAVVTSQRYTDVTVAYTLKVIKQGKYQITQGDDQIVRRNQTATFKSNADFAKFVEVRVDGSRLAPACYAPESGSTKITLTKDYIKTLSLGEHTLTIVSNDGAAAGTFTVKAAYTAYTHDSPRTGDTTNTTLWLTLTLVGLAGILAGILAKMLLIKGKRK